MLDEPSIGLHPRDNSKLLDTLERLRDLGNTVLVVEHDEETIRRADHVIDLGPGAGAHGGFLVAQGTPEDIAANPASLTGRFIAGDMSNSGSGRTTQLERQGHRSAWRARKQPQEYRCQVSAWIVHSGDRCFRFSKSTLVDDILYRSLARKLDRSLQDPGVHREVTGLELIDKIIEIDQSPIGRNTPLEPGNLHRCVYSNPRAVCHVARISENAVTNLGGSHSM